MRVESGVTTAEDPWVTSAPVASRTMWQLTNTIRHYPWGSRTVIPELLGDASPADQPYAELWMGAHPDAPSVLADGRTLDAAIAAEPDRLLSTAVRHRFGDRLPFLMKVLAADSALSLQAHPTTAQAEVGFAAEEAARQKTFEDAAYRCPACGYTYDETAGDPHNGVAAGTPWSAVPNEWNCPECGVRDKVDFVPVDAKAAGSEAVSAD